MTSGRPAGGAPFPRVARLRDGGAIDRVFRQGRRVERPAFALVWIGAPGARTVAITAGRRLGGSVARNRARRRLREAYRRVNAHAPGRGVQCCLVARAAALRQPFAALAQDLGAALAAVAPRAR
jgi:ribonuclease P protein component